MSTAQTRENFILLPYRLLKPKNGSRLSVLGAFILGQIWSYAKEGNDCKYGYKNFSERLHVSRATVARQVSKIKERDDVTAERTGGKPTTYTTTFELEDGAYIDAPLWITKPFECTYTDKETKAKRTEIVSLTPAEQLVLAMIYTETKQLNKKGKKAIEASPATISNKLQKAICTRTVKGALLHLTKIELIYRHKTARNGQGAGLGGYVANLSQFRSILSARRRAEKRINKKLETAEKELAALKRAQISKKTYEKAIEDANARADRAHFYALKRQEAQARADKYTLAAYARDPKLKKLDIELSRYEIEIAKAELFEPSKFADVAERRRKLVAERAAILSRFGLVAERFDVEYWTTCKLCHDTGTRTDGTACDCWRP